MVISTAWRSNRKLALIIMLSDKYSSRVLYLMKYLKSSIIYRIVLWKCPNTYSYLWLLYPLKLFSWKKIVPSWGSRLNFTAYLKCLVYDRFSINVCWMIEKHTGIWCKVNKEGCANALWFLEQYIIKKIGLMLIKQYCQMFTEKKFLQFCCFLFSYIIFFPMSFKIKEIWSIIDIISIIIITLASSDIY